MTNSGLSGDPEQRLRAHGFTPVERSSGGPMGSAMFLFTDGVVDVSVFDDRGQQGVGVGVRGGTTYEIQVWRHLLGISLSVPLSVDDQLAWVLHHLENVRTMIEHDAGTDERLREINWAFVKDRLGFGPDADQNDPRTWRRI